MHLMQGLLMTKGEKVIAWIEGRLIVPEGLLMGQKVKLAPFQKKFILKVYDNPHGTREAILSMGRKNAKTALTSMLMLAHLDGPVASPNTEISSGARSREQAALIFRYASEMVRLSPHLRNRIAVTPSNKKLVGLALNVKYQALSAEADTQIGGSPKVVIIDEPGRVIGSHDAFISALTTGQAAHKDPLTIYIGTQAANDADLFSILIDDALSGRNPRSVISLHAAEEGCDVLSEDAWKAANPAYDYFMNKEELKHLAEKAHALPTEESTFRNLNLNQRVVSGDVFVPLTVWRNCNAKPQPLREDIPIYGGLDLSGTTDLTSLVLIQEIDGVWQVHPYFWSPRETLEPRSRRDKAPYTTWYRKGYMYATDGFTVEYSQVVRDIAEILDGMTVGGIAFDRWRIEEFHNEIKRLGLQFKWELVGFGQGFKDMGKALPLLEKDLLNKRVAHGDNPVLTMCASNVVAISSPAGDKKFDKRKSSGRIDGMVALAMARAAVNMSPQEIKQRSVYETRGLVSMAIK